MPEQTNPEQTNAGRSRVEGKSFGRARKLGIAVTVVATAAVAIAVWGVLQFVLTRAKLRTTIDWSRGAKFTISEETKALIDQLRTREDKLEIHTFLRSHLEFARPQNPPGVQRVAPIQEACVRATYDLLRRLDYLGGDQVTVKIHDIYRDIRASGNRANELGLSDLNVVTVKIGLRKRSLDLLRQMADIELPPVERNRPGQLPNPVLRAYKGEEAIASALGSLLAEEELTAYWVTSFDTAPFHGPTGNAGDGVAPLARAMRDSGFRNKKLDLRRDANVPQDCRLLILAGPEAPLSPRAVGAIHAYVKNGGRVLMTTGVTSAGAGSSQISFKRLLQPYGMSLGDKWVFNALRDPQNPTDFRFGDLRCSRIVVRSGMNRSHPVTARLLQRGEPVELERARSISLADPMPEGTQADILLSTHSKSWLVDVPPFNARPSLAVPRKADQRTFHVGACVEVEPATADGKKGRFCVVAGLAFRKGTALGNLAGSLFQANRLFGVYLVNWLVRDKKFVPVATGERHEAKMNVAPTQVGRAKLWLVWLVPGLFLSCSFLMLFWRRRA